MWEEIKVYLGINELKNNHTYKLFARNGHIGIWDAGKKEFTIARKKFNNTFLFNEVHWDADGRFGTVKPYSEVEKTPAFSNDKEKLGYLEALEIEHKEEHNEKLKILMRGFQR
ncbi:MAG: hypothetical protein DDT19_00757 [Syntrophomonadaceae bacterium]|nr:hypothetical protein [Bacillota bacterium]